MRSFTGKALILIGLSIAMIAAPCFVRFQSALADERVWNEWTYVTGSKELEYRSEVVKHNGNPLVQFRGPKNRQFEVVIQRSEKGERKSNKNYTVRLNDNGKDSCTAWYDVVESVSLR